MASTEELTARLDALKKARDSGALTVRHGETWTTFRSLAEMERIIRSLEIEIGRSASTARRVRTIRLHTRDGW